MTLTNTAERPTNGKLRIVISFSVAMLLLLLTGLYLYFSARKYNETTAWVSHSQHVIAEARGVLSLVQEIESSQRGYVVTGDEDFLLPYTRAKSRIDSLGSLTSSLITDNSEQQALFRKIKKVYQAKIDFSTSVVETYKNEGSEAAVALMKTQRGEDYMAELRNDVSVFVKNEESLLKSRLETANGQFDQVVGIILGIVILAIVILLTTLFFFIKDYNRRVFFELQAIESRDLIENILEILPVGVFIIDTNGKPYLANAASQKILGSGIAPEGTKATLPDIYPTYYEDTDERYDYKKLPIVRALSGERVIADETLQVERNGTERLPLRVSATPLYNSSGKIEFGIAVFEDITDARKAKMELEEAKHTAEEALVLKEAFLANMSHEIRTPMNAILGFTDLLLKKELSEESKEYVSIIRSSGENLLRIINDILDISKMDAKMMVFEDHPISIPDLFKSLQSMMFNKAKEKNLDLRFYCDEALPSTVIGDPTRLTQVILNLVGNGIKFTKQGSVKVYANLVSQDEQNCVVEFEVKDTGIGIPSDKIDHIFGRFQQAEVHTTRSYGGTGLGLSIARQLVELQGGEMRIESEVDRGSTFVFTLSFKKSDTKKKQKDKKATFNDFDAIRRLKILMAEDNPINVKLITTIFNEHQITIDIAENGKIVLEKVKANAYDVILMDLEMPEMNGYVATGHLRKELMVTTPIIAMTAHAMAGEQEKCLELGMNDFISKPINFQQLFEKIYQITGGSTPKKPESQSEQAVVDVVANAVETNQPKQIDTTYLKELSSGNLEFEREMIVLFLNQVPEDTAALKTAFEAGNLEEIRVAAHKLKSSLAIVGANSLLAHIAVLENTQDKSSVDAELATHFEAYKKELEVCYQELTSLLESDYIE